jgi:3-polyprenyl-4-hydroxybenzoate decarboxylase
VFCRNLETVARSGLELARDLARIKHGEAQNLLNRSAVSLARIKHGEAQNLLNRSAVSLARIKHGEAQNLLNRSVVSLVMEDCSLELVW